MVLILSASSWDTVGCIIEQLYIRHEVWDFRGSGSNKSLLAVVSAFARESLLMRLGRLPASRRHLPAGSGVPVNVAPRGRVPCRARTPNTSLLVVRPTIRVRSPRLRVVRIASGVIGRIPASSSANNTISKACRLCRFKTKGKGERDVRCRDPWCSLRSRAPRHCRRRHRLRAKRRTERVTRSCLCPAGRAERR